MIYDCFTFFNELDLLELRLEIMDKYVDRFVIAEADTTHSGIAKPFFFEQSFNRFKRWADKIIYLKISGLPRSENRWLAENAQRNSLYQAIPASAQWVLIGDIDEIPYMPTWTKREGVFSQGQYLYKLNLTNGCFWNGSVIVRGWRFYSPYGKMNPQDCRNFRDILCPVGTGWHFQHLGDWKTKLQSFAHAEFDKEYNYTLKEQRLDPNTKTPLRVVSISELPQEVQNEPLKWALYLEKNNAQ